jgi:hypothetical protein
MPKNLKFRNDIGFNSLSLEHKYMENVKRLKPE